jgi:hypothetical protein
MESKMLSPFFKFTLFGKTSSFSFFSFPGTFGGLGMISGFKEDNGTPPHTHTHTQVNHIAAFETQNQNNPQPCPADTQAHTLSQQQHHPQ